MSERTPAACVAVAARNRPVRLRWLLNALDEQTLAPAQLEVIVACDPSSEATEQLLRTHPLSEQGRLRQVSFPAHSTLPGAGRNAAWRAARAPLILFTDDDCRPDPRWAERAIAAAQRSPGALLQGATVPDPEETAVLLGAPWARTVLTNPPTPWAETCNIAYPRRLLEELGGFDEHMRVGEDTDLALRAQSHGARISAVPEMLVYHAVGGPVPSPDAARVGAVAGPRPPGQAPPLGAPPHVGLDLVEARARRAVRRAVDASTDPAPSGAGRPGVALAGDGDAPSWLRAAGHRAFADRATGTGSDRVLRRSSPWPEAACVTGRSCSSDALRPGGLTRDRRPGRRRRRSVGSLPPDIPARFPPRDSADRGGRARVAARRP